MKELFEGIWLMPAEDLTYTLNVFLEGFLVSVSIGVLSILTIVLTIIGLYGLFQGVFPRLYGRWLKYKTRRRLRKTHRRKHF